MYINHFFQLLPSEDATAKQLVVLILSPAYVLRIPYTGLWSLVAGVLKEFLGNPGLHVTGRVLIEIITILTLYSLFVGCVVWNKPLF